MTFTYDVCLSHSAKDKAVVRPLAERLRTCRAVAARRRRQHGLKVWPVAPKRPRVGGFHEWVLKPADSIPAKMDPLSLRRSGETWEGLEPSNFGLRTSDFGFAQPGMSANAFGSGWARLEAGTFRFRESLNKQRRIGDSRFN